MSAHERTWRLLRLAGVLRVTVCGLCGAVVVHEGRRQRADMHRADARRGSS